MFPKLYKRLWSLIKIASACTRGNMHAAHTILYLPANQMNALNSPYMHACSHRVPTSYDLLALQTLPF